MGVGITHPNGIVRSDKLADVTFHNKLGSQKERIDRIVALSREIAPVVGAEPDELEFLVFDPGRADLSPPELEKAGKIAEALSLRPELALEIGGVYATEEDGVA